MRVASGDHGDPQALAEAVREPLGALAVAREVLAVEVYEVEGGELLVGELGDVPRRAEGVCRAKAQAYQPGLINGAFSSLCAACV